MKYVNGLFHLRNVFRDRTVILFLNVDELEEKEND